MQRKFMGLQMFKVVVLLGMLFVCNLSVTAGTIVEIQNKDGMTSIFSEDLLVRIEMSDSEYAIVDYKNNSVKVVDSSKKQVMLLTIKNIDSRYDANAVNIAINKVGIGQTISGYETQKYRYAANGNMCGYIYGSQAAYEKKNVKNLFTAVDYFMNKQYALLGSYARLIDACTLADMQVGRYVNNFGVPMRTEKNGSIENEIKSIQLDVSFPENTFIVPATYKTLSM